MGKRMKKFRAGVRRSSAVAILLMLVLSALTSCGFGGDGARSPEAAVTAMCDALRATEKGLPRGQLYVSDAREGEAGYVTDTLLSSFLGDGREVPWQAEAAESYAFYLSYSSPVTLAVFRCGSVGGAEELAILLSERMRLYRTYWAGSEWEEAVLEAAVVVSGRDVFFAVAPDGKALIRRARGRV